MKAVLLYASAENVAAKAPPHFPAHRQRLDEFHQRGDLLMVGTFGDPQAQGSMAVFRSHEAAKEFARGDPFVLNGVVRAWEVREWDESLADPLAEALHVPGPSGPHAERLMLFGRFVGSWTLEWSAPGAEPAAGELHFGWVLGGRAVQDLWIVPGRGQPGEGQPPLGFHGSTIRFYDPAIDAWRSTWIEPVNGRVRRFIGRPHGDEIVLLSDEDDPQLRWRFTAIEPDSFIWRSESSSDGGTTWRFDEQMIARRRAER
jgi:uncharacterized protein YciI